MTKARTTASPMKFTSGTLTLFEVRVLGAFVGSYFDLATALGVEADVIKNLAVQEILDKEEFPKAASGDEDRLFQAIWTDQSGRRYLRYAA